MTKLIGLQASNFKRLRAVDITFPTSGGALAVMGSNEAGKSSLLDALEVAIAGRKAPKMEQPIHAGADEARVIKLMINMMVFMSTAVIGEGLAFGERAGLDRALMVDAINDSIVGSPHYRTKADKLKQREYGAAGPISLVVKDLDLALAVARENAVALPISSLVRQYLAMMQQRDLGHLDIAALADVPAWSSAPDGGPC